MMETSDLLALAALLVATLSVVYSKHAIAVSKRSNEISTHHQLRPLRLAAYNSMRTFARFCETYRTMQHGGAVEQTRDLDSGIASFKWEIDQHGPLEMPEVEEKANELQSKAWLLLRALDRIAGRKSQPFDVERETSEANRDELVEWFHNQGCNLRELFTPYLSGA